VYYCPHRGRYVNLAVTFHGPQKHRPGPGLGPELTEALRPRGILWRYYEGGHRITLGGAPCRVSASVATWSAFSRGCVTSYLTGKQYRKVAADIADWPRGAKAKTYPPEGGNRDVW
jgi:hypothetical protein